MAAATWVTGARLRTLPAAVAPVAVGTAVAHYEGQAIWWKAVLALVVALALQVGTNYANDYSDGIRGTDDNRVGPVRLVASGLATAEAVKRAAYAAFAVGAIAGFVLAVTTAWWLVLVGAAAIAAGWFYTGGPRPYGYAPLGEVSVFVFFGLVATAGTAYVQTEQLTVRAALLGCAMGAMACALLVINNLRDIRTDSDSGKRTLAVSLGDRNTRRLYVFLLLAAGVSALVGVPKVDAGMALIERRYNATLFVFLIWTGGMVFPASSAMRQLRGRELVRMLSFTTFAQLGLAALIVGDLVIAR